MGFTEWKRWVGSLPWSLRWFVFLVLFRPVIDNFYLLKEISPLLSPLYIVGVLVPVLIVGTLFSGVLPPRQGTVLDQLFGFWGFLIFFNAFALLTLTVTLLTLEIALKLVTPVLIYFFLRRLVRSKRDLHGIAMTFIYSAVFPFAMLLYENTFSAIGVQESRNLVRYQGGYADVMNYALYIIGGFLVASYFFMEKSKAIAPSKALLGLGVVGGLCLVGLLSIHHGASWAIFGALGVLLILHNARGKQASVLVFVLLIGATGYYFFEEEVNESIEAIYAVDMEVLEGEKDVDRALHGRVGRWKRFYRRWNELSVLPKTLGSALSSEPWRGTYLTEIHNDYLRIMSTSGVLGLLVYLMMYVYLFFKSFGRPSSETFLIQGMLAVFLLFSISTTPTLYAPLVYIGFSVLAYAALPQRKRNEVPATLVRRPRRPARMLKPAP